MIHANGQPMRLGPLVDMPVAGIHWFARAHSPPIAALGMAIAACPAAHHPVGIAT
jgi:hypothetical protein